MQGGNALELVCSDLVLLFHVLQVADHGDAREVGHDLTDKHARMCLKDGVLVLADAANPGSMTNNLPHTLHLYLPAYLTPLTHSSLSTHSLHTHPSLTTTRPGFTMSFRFRTFGLSLSVSTLEDLCGSSISV